MAQYDIIVCGLGVMGSAALYHLAKRGRRVLGIEQFKHGHDRGSSHGETRIIRLAYFEHPSYVPLLRRAYTLWRELERDSGRPLLHVTGVAEIGPRTGTLIEGTLAAARLHDLPHEILSSATFMQRYPAFRLPAHFIGVVQPDGGYLAAEPALEALLAMARCQGADIRSGTTVQAIEPLDGRARVIVDGDIIDAATVIVAAGPWTASLLRPLAVLPLRTTRQVMGWFAPIREEQFTQQRFPVFLLESAHGIHYGFPPQGTAARGNGIKVAKHHHADEAVDPDVHQREVSATDEALIRTALAAHLPDANGAMVDARTCLYTVTPDGNFIIDRLPNAGSIVVASPCSGHGFKFAPAIGEMLADLCDGRTPQHDMSRFRMSRFE